jgi:hypothetical protein
MGVRGSNQLDCASEGVRIDERVTVARVFTREQFYELVWSKPMTHLAKDFAISDVALHKICRKHGIPNPPLGWWAKKAAGKKVKQTPLPEAKPGAADRITISDGELGRESANLAAAREQARIQASDGDDNEAAPPHPIVDRTIATLRKAKPSDIGLVAVSQGGLIKCEVAPRSVDRLAVILPRIVRAASLQGFQLVGGEGAAHFESETEVNVFGGGTGPRRSFRDAKIQRLETMASEIGVGLAVLAAAKTEQRLKREAEERRREEERRRRELAERAKHIEDRRIAGLEAILAELDELDRLRRLIAMLTTEVAAEPTARLTTFLSWAQDHVAKREARLSAPAIEERFAAEHLFGDDDDHAFTPSRWY